MWAPLDGAERCRTHGHPRLGPGPDPGALGHRHRHSRSLPGYMPPIRPEDDKPFVRCCFSRSCYEGIRCTREGRHIPPTVAAVGISSWSAHKTKKWMMRLGGPNAHHPPHRARKLGPGVKPVWRKAIPSSHMLSNPQARGGVGIKNLGAFGMFLLGKSPCRGGIPR